MKKIILALVLLSASLTSSQLLARSVLAIKSSTMSAGGNIQIPIEKVKDQDAQVGLTVAPELHYFLTRNFALGLAPAVSRESMTGKGSPWNFLMAISGTYFFDLGGALYPFIGAKAGIGWQTEQKGYNFVLGAPIGVLVALNNHVALKFGVPVDFHFNGDGYLAMRIPIGYVGVQAFF